MPQDLSHVDQTYAVIKDFMEDAHSKSTSGTDASEDAAAHDVIEDFSGKSAEDVAVKNKVKAGFKDFKEDSNSINLVTANPRKYFPPSPNPVFKPSPAGPTEDATEPFRFSSYVDDVNEDILPSKTAADAKEDKAGVTVAADIFEDHHVPGSSEDKNTSNQFIKNTKDMTEDYAGLQSGKLS